MAGQFWLNNQINDNFTWSIEFGGVNVIDHPIHFNHGITPIELIAGESSKIIAYESGKLSTNVYDLRAIPKPHLNQ